MICITRTMLSQDVRLSVTRRYFVETAKHVLELFSPSASHTNDTILVFPYQTVWQYYHGRSPNGGVKCGGGLNDCDFQPISCFVSEMIQGRAGYYGRRIESRTHAFDWYHFQWPWVNPNLDFKVTMLFNVKCLKTVQDRAKLTTAEQ